VAAGLEDTLISGYTRLAAETPRRRIDVELRILDVVFAGLFGLLLLPAIVVIAVGLDPLRILILSQVVLSFTLPFALVPLLMLTGNRELMKQFRNSRVTHWLGWITVSIIIVLNVFLLWQQV